MLLSERDSFVENLILFSRVADGWQHVAATIKPTGNFDWIEVYYKYYNQSEIHSMGLRMTRRA